jgi:hypothetical protein
LLIAEQILTSDEGEGRRIETCGRAEA